MASDLLEPKEGEGHGDKAVVDTVKNGGGTGSPSSSRKWKAMGLTVLKFIASLVVVLIKLVVEALGGLKATAGVWPAASPKKNVDKQKETAKVAEDCKATETEGGEYSKDLALLSEEQVLENLKKGHGKMRDTLNLRRVQNSDSKVQLTDSEKINKYFSEIIKPVSFLLDEEDMLNLRLVNHSFKSGLDAYWSTMTDLRITIPVDLPAIYLTDLQKVSRFTKDMSLNSFASYPFVTLVGPWSPSDPYYTCYDDDYMDQLSLQVFWKAFARCTAKIGSKIHRLVLDIRIDPVFGVSFAESIVSVIVGECLTHVVNLEYLVFITNTVNVEKALSAYYSVKDHNNPTRFPSLEKLVSLEILTLGEGHPSKSKFKTRSMTFPARFLRQHSSSINMLRIYANLYDFKTMGQLQAPLLEMLQFEAHHCHCQGRDPDLKALLQLPIVEQELPGQLALKEVSVRINWQWRTSDMSSFFKWLGRNYPYHTFDRIELKNSRNPLRNGHQYRHYNNPDYPMNEEHLEEREPACARGLELSKKGGSGYGSDFPWITTLKLPPVRVLELHSEYEGSWQFLGALRGTLERVVLQKQMFFRNEEEMKQVFRKGLVNDIFGQEVLLQDDELQQRNKNGVKMKGVVVWNHFPKLKEIVVVWKAINFKNINWGMDVIMRTEDYKKKGIMTHMRWSISREEFYELEGKQK